MGLRGRRVGDDFDPVGELDPLNEFRQLVVAIEPAPAFLSSIDELGLNTIASAVLFERPPFERIVRCRTVAKVLSIGFEVLRCFQCSAGKS